MLRRQHRGRMKGLLCVLLVDLQKFKILNSNLGFLEPAGVSAAIGGCSGSSCEGLCRIPRRVVIGELGWVLLWQLPASFCLKSHSFFRVAALLTGRSPNSLEITWLISGGTCQVLTNPEILVAIGALKPQSAVLESALNFDGFCLLLRLFSWYLRWSVIQVC